MSKYIIEESNPYAIEILKFMGAKELVECKDCENRSNDDVCKWHYSKDYKWCVDDDDFCSCARRWE